MNEVNCSDEWKFVSCHCLNGIYRIQCIDFDQYYNPVAHADSFGINIDIVAIHILTASILDISNASSNKNVPIHERVYFSPLPYYLDWFEISYPNVPLN